MREKTSGELVEQMRSAAIIAGKVRTLREASGDPMVQNRKLTSKDEKTDTEIVLASAPHITPYLEAVGRRLPFPPRLGEHNEPTYKGDLGVSRRRIAELKEKGTI